MSLLRKRPHVDPVAVERKVATILPWSGGGLTARAVTQRAGRGGNRVAVCIDVTGQVSQTARFRADEIGALVTGRSIIAETVNDAPDLMFLVYAGTQPAGSAAAEVTAGLPEGTLVLLHTNPELRIVGTATPPQGAEFGQWVRTLP